MAVLDLSHLLDIQVKTLSRKLDVKVWKEAWEGDKYLGVDSMWTVFKNVTKGVREDKEMF